MFHPNDPNLSFNVDAHQSTNKGETYSIHSVFYKDQNITEFVTEYADQLFSKWEEEINDCVA